ncbi:MAG TPA: ATP-binding protein [Mycobacteriales bacterium]|nr:ATP-binding protein [Mycobacteriales bacterium]
MTLTDDDGAPTVSSAWSLRRRLRRLLAGLSVLVIVLIALSVGLLVSVRHQQHQVIDRYFTAINISDQRFIAQLDAETAVRGYALTGATVTLQPLTHFKTAAYHQQLVRLQALLRPDPAAEKGLTTWEAATDRWYQQSALPTQRHIASQGRGSVTPQSVLAGKTLFDANRTAFNNYVNPLIAKRNSASNALKVRTTLLFVAVLIAALGILAAGGLLWIGLRRWVVDPLSHLGDETRLVADGDLQHEVAAEGPSEIRQLGEDVDGMRREIVRQLAEVERARVEIETARLTLARQAEDLARSNRDLEQFAYVASHDLQEPLRKVASFCQMLERRYTGQLDERADQYIAFAVDGAKRMQQLINDLLAFSRVGRMSAGMTQVSLRDCFETAVSNLTVSIDTADAVITHDPLPTVRGERTLLVQLFQNLIGNAIKFRGDETPKVHIGSTREGEFWEISCADNGIGIEPQYADRIFVIFQRLHGREEYTGTGIGLALCKRIVEYHGGELWLDTTVTQGTTFRWTLPVRGATVRPDPQGTPTLEAGTALPVEKS